MRCFLGLGSILCFPLRLSADRVYLAGVATRFTIYGETNTNGINVLASVTVSTISRFLASSVPPNCTTGLKYVIAALQGDLLPLSSICGIRLSVYLLLPKPTSY